MFGDLGKMMKAAAHMKQRLPEIQEQLAASTYTAQSGGGAVTATVNGRMGLVDLVVAPQVLADGDAAMLADMVKAAISAAQTKAAEAGRAALAELTGGISIPGMDGLMP